MTRRIAKKIPQEWTRADLGERPRPRYTRDQVWAALNYNRGRRMPADRQGWKFSYRDLSRVPSERWA